MTSGRPLRQAGEIWKVYKLICNITWLYSPFSLKIMSFKLLKVFLKNHWTLNIIFFLSRLHENWVVSKCPYPTIPKHVMSYLFRDSFISSPKYFLNLFFIKVRDTIRDSWNNMFQFVHVWFISTVVGRLFNSKLYLPISFFYI